MSGSCFGLFVRGAGELPDGPLVHFDIAAGLFRCVYMKTLDVPFSRVPNWLLDAAARSGLTGTEYRVLLWVIRATFGWNRQWAVFTWYRIAQDIGASRPVVYRAGVRLLAGGILMRRGDELAVAYRQRRALLRDNGSDAGRQRNRFFQATLFRRTKDSNKDILNTFKDRLRHSEKEREWPARRDSEGGFAVGAYEPVRETYDSVPED